MRDILDSLEGSELVIVPTDNTNSFRSIGGGEMIMLYGHLEKSAKEIDRKSKTYFENARGLVDEVEYFILRKEVGHIN